MAWQQWQAFSQKFDDGPLADEIGRKTTVEQKELKANTQLFPKKKEKGIVRQLGYPYTVEFTIDWADEAPGTVLLSNERSTFYLSDPIKGMLGFSRDGYLFNFKYRGKAGKRETLQLKGDNQGISLYADGKLVERLDPDVQWRNNGKGTYKIMRTLVFPLQQTGSFRSRITGFSAKRQTESR